MTASDLDQLIEMGFERERAELAVSKTGSCKFAAEVDPSKRRSLTRAPRSKRRD